MEIRSSPDMMMDDTDNKTSSPDEELLSVPRPASPCDSEISVGCENESSDPTPPSPMDMTEAMTEDDEQIVNGPSSPESSKASSQRTPARPRSRGASIAPSPQSLSPASVHAEGSEESCSYMSEEEYFRPLKRLAMSDGSPRPPSSSCTRDNMSETMSSPEPSHHLHLQHIPLPSPDEECPSVPSETGVRLDTNEDVVTPEEESPHIEGGRNNVVVVVDPNNKLTAGLRSFSILDILSYKPSRRKSSNPVKIVRPWDTREDDSSSDSTTPTPRYRSVAKSSNNNNSTSKNNNKSATADGKKQTDDRGSALDALFKMTNKTLDDLNKEDKADAVNLFNNRQPSKKKRKSRTAFTNHQIFELEKRFLYQKYLSPADRDELAQSLGLSNAQVITWFQNRRAKLKRDMEELKRDVETSKVIHNKSLLQASANVVAFLKAKELPKLQIDLASLRR